MRSLPLVVSLVAAFLFAGAVAGASAGPSYRGNGDKRLPAFSVAADSTLYWTNTGGRFGIIPRSLHGGVNATAAKGWTYLPPGRYSLQVGAVGPWTIRVTRGVVAPTVLPGGRRGYSGNGSLELAPFDSAAGPLRWTNSGDVLQVYSEDAGGTGGVNSAKHRGSAPLAAGTHHLLVNAIGNWTISWPAPTS
jgi:hypothetical protein